MPRSKYRILQWWSSLGKILQQTQGDSSPYLPWASGEIGALEMDGDGNNLVHIFVSDPRLLDIEIYCAIRMLWDEGLDLFHVNIDGDTPLDVAMRRKLAGVTEYLVSLKNHPAHHLFQHVVHGRMEQVKKALEHVEDLHSIKQSVPRAQSSRKQSPSEQQKQSAVAAVAAAASHVVSCEVYRRPVKPKLEHDQNMTSDSDSITLDSDSDSDEADDEINSDSSSSSSDEDFIRIDDASVKRIVETKINGCIQTVAVANAVECFSSDGESSMGDSERFVRMLLDDVLSSATKGSKQLLLPTVDQIGAFKEELNYFDSDGSDSDMANDHSMRTQIDTTFDNLKLDLSYINSSSDVSSDDEVLHDSSDSDLETGETLKDMNTQRYYTKLLDVAVKRGYENISMILLEKRAIPTDQTIWDAIGQGMSTVIRKCTELEYKIDFSTWVLKAANLKTFHLRETTYALCKAVSSGNLETVKLVFAACGELNVSMTDIKVQSHSLACGLDFGTPLLTAAIIGSVDIAEWLMYMGANVNIGNCVGYTPLMGAVFESPADTTIKIVELLLRKGADVNAKDKRHQTPLLYCAQRNDSICNSDIITVTKILLEHGAAMDEESLWAVTSHSGTGGYRMKSYGLCSSSFSALHKVVNQSSEFMAYGVGKLLLEHNIREKKVIKYVKHASVLKLLSDHGVRSTMFNFFDTVSKLHCNVDIIKYYLGVGYSQGTVDNKGRNALHYTARAGCSDTIKLLTEHGYDVDATDQAGWTPLMHACYNYETGTNSDMCQTGEYVEKIQLLLSLGADPNHHSRSGHTPLRCAQSYREVTNEQKTHQPKCSCQYTSIMTLLYYNCNPHALTLCLAVVLPQGYMLSTRKKEVPSEMQEGIKPASPVFISYSQYQPDVVNLLHTVGANMWSIMNNIYIDGRISTHGDRMLDLLMKVYRQLSTGRRHKLFKYVSRVRGDPMTLKRICRSTVRLAVRQPFLENVTTLPVEEHMQRYIRIPEFHDYLFGPDSGSEYGSESEVESDDEVAEQTKM